jgi:hypothetical protein
MYMLLWPLFQWQHPFRYFRFLPSTAKSAFKNQQNSVRPQRRPSSERCRQSFESKLFITSFLNTHIFHILFCTSQSLNFWKKKILLPSTGLTNLTIIYLFIYLFIYCSVSRIHDKGKEISNQIPSTLINHRQQWGNHTVWFSCFSHIRLFLRRA